MNRNTLLLWLVLSILGVHDVASAQDSKSQANSGTVEVPLETYNALRGAAQSPPQTAPASFALGSARVTVSVADLEVRSRAAVEVELEISVFEDRWTLIPVLPVGTALASATIGGDGVQLVPTPSGLAWSTNRSGTYRMVLAYRVDPASSRDGYSLPVPLPEAASTSLSASIPGAGLDVSVIPAADVRSRNAAEQTRVTATIPTTRGVQISWRSAVDLGPVVSRARYRGELVGESIVWQGELDVELFGEPAATLAVLPRSVTLEQLEVDGETTPILVEGEHFAISLRGRGSHTVAFTFQSPILRGNGPPSVVVKVPEVPVSRFDLVLPGKKEVSVEPAASVSSSERDGATVARVFVPLSESVTFAWAEAIPEEIRTEVRLNAGVFHAVHAEEGVLSVLALAEVDITRGETNAVQLEVPAGIQVNRVTSPSGAVADWRIESGEDATEKQRITVFLDRMVTDEIALAVHYDRSLPTTDAIEAGGVEVPLVEMSTAHRVRGMVALLSSQDLTLDPLAEGSAARVGENQLPAEFRSELEMTVAHTYKYTQQTPALVVRTVEPQRELGRFDVRVDTLVSLEDVALEASATVEVNVKSGRIMNLELLVPTGVNLLRLSGPSIGHYRILESGGTESADQATGQRVEVEFTQEMQGQFRLEVGYELIFSDLGREAALTVPTLAVSSAEVEQGRIAVEALSAVEVRAVSTTNLTALDVAELPRQLVLRTTNPILLAYKYVHVEPAYDLKLEVTRHELIDVQDAAIDRADYRTLFTTDGLAVTTARFMVRNSRKQFLELQLPEGARVWSAFVDGRPEKPAAADRDEGNQSKVLLKIVNSTEGFLVDLVFATSGPRIGGLGTVLSRLPRPDILVTESRWDIYLPAELRYRRPRGNLELKVSGEPVSGADVTANLIHEDRSREQAIGPLRISVPQSGIKYSFEKLYANQSDEDSWFAIGYASKAGARLGLLLSVAGTVMLWLGLWAGIRSFVRRSVAIAGGLLLVATVGFYHVDPTAAVLTSLLVLFGVARRSGWSLVGSRREEPAR